MVVEARRAAPADDGDLADLGTISPARRALSPTPSPTRRLSRVVLAPVAALSVLGLAAGIVFLPPTGDALEARQVAMKAAPLGISRSDERAPLQTHSPDLPEAQATTAAPTQEPLDTSTAAQLDTALAPAVEASAPAVATEAPAVEAPAVEATPEPAKPSFDPTALGKAVGPRYTTAGVNVRTGPGTGFDVRRTVAEGAEVTITDKVVDGWRQVTMSKKAGWIKESYLTEKKPAAPKKAATTKTTAGKATTAKASGSAVSGQPCAKAGKAVSGLTDRAETVLRSVCANFPGVSSYGGRRASGGNHGTGRAIDVMVSGSYGWEIANWARANAKSLGITEVIYEQKIWTTQRAGDGWRGMSNRGSASANHYDHVHLSVR